MVMAGRECAQDSYEGVLRTIDPTHCHATLTPLDRAATQRYGFRARRATTGLLNLEADDAGC